MRTSSTNSLRCPHAGAFRRRERGSLVILLLMLLSILLIYVTANLRTLSWLKREIRLVEQHQIKRLESLGASTNAPPAVAQPAPSTSRP